MQQNIEYGINMYHRNDHSWEMEMNENRHNVASHIV